MIEQLLEYNREFVKSGAYEKFQTSKYPDKKIAILTCMDTRLVELLPAALGIRNGDVKMIKNAGGMITGPFDSAVRSLLVGIVELGGRGGHGHWSHGLRRGSHQRRHDDPPPHSAGRVSGPH